MTLGKNLTVLSFGISTYEAIEVTTHCISARVIGGGNVIIEYEDYSNRMFIIEVQ